MNICDLFKNLSIETWERIKFSRESLGFKIFETTITQNLLFNIGKFKVQSLSNNIRIFESIDEFTNGNDIECFIQSESGKFIFFPIQSKIIVHSNRNLSDGKYPAFKEIQFNNLNSYANKERGIPLYLFYNYSSNFGNENHGCLIYKAKDLEKQFYNSKNFKWKKFKFSDLIKSNLGFTWDNLVCKKLRIKSSGITNLATIEDERFNEERVKTYFSEELIYDQHWVEIGVDRDNRITKWKPKVKRNRKSDNIFSPKTRILISSDKEVENNLKF